MIGLRLLIKLGLILAVVIALLWYDLLTTLAEFFEELLGALIVASRAGAATRPAPAMGGARTRSLPPTGGRLRPRLSGPVPATITALPDRVGRHPTSLSGMRPHIRTSVWKLSKSTRSRSKSARRIAKDEWRSVRTMQETSFGSRCSKRSTKAATNKRYYDGQGRGRPEGRPQSDD